MTVTADGPMLDGIVFDTSSTSKTVVAVVAPGHTRAAMHRTTGK